MLSESYGPRPCVWLFGFCALSALLPLASAQTSSADQQPLPLLDQKAYVHLSLNAVMGPLGYVPVSVATSKTVAPSPVSSSGNSVFPSIYFSISASPVDLDLEESKQILPKEDGTIHLIKSADDVFEAREPDWIEVHFELQAIPKDKTTLAKGNSGCDGLQVLGLLPNSTISEAHQTTPQLAANSVAEVVTAFAPASLPFKGMAQSSSQALAILFNNLMKPKPVAYQYAEMENSCHFGWYFQKSGNVSLLGLQSGVVLLRADENVSSIKVTGRAVSKWVGKGENKGGSLIASKQTFTLEVPESGEQAVNFDTLQDLSNFPIVIPIEDVAKILHTSCTTLLPATVQQSAANICPGDPQETIDASMKPKLMFTPNYKYVTKGSLQSYLNPAPDASKQQPPPGGTPAGSGQDTSKPHVSAP
jgi:hypothetical protein